MWKVFPFVANDASDDVSIVATPPVEDVSEENVVYAYILVV